MATTFGPEMAVMDPSASSLGALDRPSTRRVPPAMLTFEPAHRSPRPEDPADAPQESPKTGPASPLPAFVFPAKPSPSSAPPSFSRASGRRSRSVMEIQDPATLSDKRTTREPSAAPRKSPALPDFSFNPGGPSTSPDAPADESHLSPSISATHSPRHIPSPSRSGGHGHRRGGSEFVGGSIRGGDSITVPVLGTSPTKSESGFASPSLSPSTVSEPAPGPPRRGQHRHRRSAAISSHDLSLILQPPKAENATRGSSAPASPADFNGQRLSQAMKTESDIPPVPTLPKPTELERLRTAEPSPSSSQSAVAGPFPREAKAVPRARVGFSDTLEFIPRPLSLVSSDASSTATARPGGHSVSGSLSSIVSMCDEPELPPQPVATIEPPVELAPPAPQTSSTGSRPSTAGAILDRATSVQPQTNSNTGSLKRRNSIPTLTHVPGPSDKVAPAEPSPSKSPKRWSLFGLDGFSHAPSLSRPRDASSGSTDTVLKPADSASTVSDHCSEVTHDAPGAASLDKPCAKKGGKKKKKKVKAWAGSILKSKSKPRKSKKSLDPSMLSPDGESSAAPDGTEDACLSEMAHSPNTPTVTITDSSDPSQPAQPWRPRSTSALDDDVSLSMIDLDAALGPFNTPLPHNPEWDAAQKAAGTAQGSSKRQLYSAQGMRGFSGPGMHYHRRAESAPEMVPFEAGRFGIPRFNSSSTMADVFEEDEEDDDGDQTGASSRPMKRGSSTVSRYSTESDGEEETPPARDQPALAPLDTQTTGEQAETDKSRAAPSMRSERSMNSVHDQVITEEPRAPVFATGSPFQDNDTSSGSATPSPRQALGTREPGPGDVSPLHLPTPSNVPISPYSMSHSSSFPSPRSPMSYDAHRISTAASSINEDNNTLQSLMLGEPGPEVRLSMDMPPSLTSSNSTMTRDSTFIPGAQPRARMPFRPDERPVSVSSAAFGRRRSSLASLSRLISSSHGERSKLSMEVSLETENQKKQKISRAKRLSRMVQFWKPHNSNKEEPPATTTTTTT